MQIFYENISIFNELNLIVSLKENKMMREQNKVYWIKFGKSRAML